ncbi:hypothetical protein [Chloroflexus sp. Y-396-1]|uniref:hypothetical protein n=1 Tax=Chloroflexus sp. Y-396-1 TaxID=867845 RepID=UPI00048C0310|nr:hypothetical protein [Chloroflexus sp. Y-396-1]
MSLQYDAPAFLTHDLTQSSVDQTGHLDDGDLLPLVDAAPIRQDCIAVVDPNRSHHIARINRANGWMGWVGMMGMDDGMAAADPDIARCGIAHCPSSTGAENAENPWRAMLPVAPPPLSAVYCSTA